MSVTGTEYKSTRVRGLADWNPAPARRRVLDDIRDVLDEYEEFWPLSPRQIGYRLLRLARYSKTENHFKQVIEVLNRGRRSGLVPWESIRDDSLHRRVPPSYVDLSDLKDEWDAAARSYRLDRQTRQDQFLEIWVEAAGMVPQVASMVEDYSIPVLSTSGYDSVTIKHQIAWQVARRDQPTVIGVIGDHDAHGLAVIDSRAEDVEQLVADISDRYTIEGKTPMGEVDFEWLAVRPDQIIALELESKPHDTSKQFVGDSIDARDRTVQAEAIDPPDLRDRPRLYQQPLPRPHLPGSSRSRGRGATPSRHHDPSARRRRVTQSRCRA